MRLNRYLASCGLGSRRSVEQIIAEGRVLINGDEVTNLATQVRDGDVVTVDGRRFTAKMSTTIILNKPKGVLCTREDETGQERDTLYDILPEHLRSLHYVGRLDKDSEGLILLTNSGELTDKLTHPRYEVEKEYLVLLDHVFRPEEHVAAMLEGMVIEGGFAKAKLVEQEAPRVVAIVLTQGIKRQVRLMFEALGYEVKRLERVRIGGFVAPELKPGRWRVLQEGEIEQLLAGRLPGTPARARKPKRPAASASARPSGPAPRPQRPDRPAAKKSPFAKKTVSRSFAPKFEDRPPARSSSRSDDSFKSNRYEGRSSSRSDDSFKSNRHEGRSSGRSDDSFKSNRYEGRSSSRSAPARKEARSGGFGSAARKRTRRD